MAKPSELKLAGDIIRRVLDAAERGDIEFLEYLKMISRQRSANSKLGAPAIQEHSDALQTNSKPNQEYLLADIARYDTEKSLGEHLRSKYRTKTEITAVARALHVPAPKTDDYETLVDRVISSTLGYKMRSQAVRGGQPSRELKDTEDKQQ